MGGGSICARGSNWALLGRSNLPLFLDHPPYFSTTPSLPDYPLPRNYPPPTRESPSKRESRPVERRTTRANERDERHHPRRARRTGADQKRNAREHEKRNLSITYRPTRPEYMQTRDERQTQHEHNQRQQMPRVTEEAKKRKDEASRQYQTENRFTIQRRRLMSRLKKHWEATGEALDAARELKCPGEVAFTPQYALHKVCPLTKKSIGRAPGKMKTRQQYGIVVMLLDDDENYFYQVAPPVDESTMVQEPAPAEETKHGDRMWGESDDEEDNTAADHRANLELEWAEFTAKYKSLEENGVLKKPNGKAYGPKTLKGYFEDNLKHDVLGFEVSTHVSQCGLGRSSI